MEAVIRCVTGYDFIKRLDIACRPEFCVITHYDCHGHEGNRRIIGTSRYRHGSDIVYR